MIVAASLSGARCEALAKLLRLRFMVGREMLEASAAGEDARARVLKHGWVRLSHAIDHVQRGM